MTDAAAQPLMGWLEREDEDVTLQHEAVEAEEGNLSNASHHLEKNLKHPGIYVWLLTFSAGISGLLFGYDTGVISATLVSIDTSLGTPLTMLDKSLVTSSTSLLALLISPLASSLADTLGRKRVLLLADVLFIAGALIQALASSVSLLILGRSVVGLAVGAGSFVAPLYIAELAPSEFRGRLVTLYVLFITVGQVVAYIVGWSFVEVGEGWRWMVGLGAVPAVVQACIMMGMPESPRWLVMADKCVEARGVLLKVFGQGSEVQGMVEVVLKGIEGEVREEEEAKRGRLRGQSKRQKGAWFAGSRDLWGEMFRVPGNRRALTIACLLQGLQQLCGFNSLMYFSATIFTLLSFTSPTLTSLSVALINFLFTTLALLLIDRIGRRRILLYLIPIMSIGLLLTSIGFHFIHLPSSSSNLTTRQGHNDEKERLNEKTAPMVVLASIMVYVGAYALGLGNVPWMQSELFPLNVRSLGSGLSTSMNWGANFIVGLTFLPMMEYLTPTWTFVVYAIVCFVGWVCIWRIYPETKGLSLEEVGELLADGWGVKGRERGGGVG